MHLMIDLETLGTNPDCVVTQIGYALFDTRPKFRDAIQQSLTNGVINSGCIFVDPSEQIKRGRSITWDTFKWWLKCNDEARALMASDRAANSVMGALMAVTDLLTDWSLIEGVWGHGIGFDIAVMESLFRMWDMQIPWHFRAARDTRTIFALVPGMVWKKATVAHSAEADAIVQAQNIQEAYSLLFAADRG